MYKRGVKCIQSFFKECKYALSEDEGLIRFITFNDIVKVLTLCVEPKSGLSIYYIKFCHSKNIFDHMLDRIGQMDLNGSSSIDIIGFRKSLNK